MQTLNGSPAEFYKKAVSVARHYGFLPFDELVALKATPKDQPRELKSAFDIAQLNEYKKLDPLGGEFTTMFGKALEKNLLPTKEPLLLYTTNLEKDGARTAKIARFNFHIFGSKQSIAEALILKAAHAVFEENGIRAVVHLNSIGDRDSSAKFARDTGLYLRQHFEALPLQTRDLLKDDSIAVLRFLVRKGLPLYAEAPRPMEFLTTQSRKHLREVIEFVETAGIPYKINDFLLGNRDCFTQTLFELHPVAETEESQSGFGGVPYAQGGRLDELGKRIAKTATPSVSLTITMKVPETRQQSSLNNRQLPKQLLAKKPRVCFIHVGFEAKLKSLAVIETFRKAKIPFYQCLQYDRLSEQLAYAEGLSVPFTVIMGQKEALDDMVIVRNTSSRAQQTVSIELLPSYFKQLHAK